MSYIIDIIGIVASITEVIGFFPQIYKVQKTKSVEDLSTLMVVNFLICSLAWVIYGVMTDSSYVAITNAAALAASFVLLAQKLYFQRKLTT